MLTSVLFPLLIYTLHCTRKMGQKIEARNTLYIHVQDIPQTLTHILSVVDYREWVNHWLEASEGTGPFIAVSNWEGVIIL